MRQEAEGRMRVVDDNVTDLGLAPLMRVDAWLHQIDDTDAEIRRRMAETATDALEEGETRAAVLPTDLDHVLDGYDRLMVTADVWPRMAGEDRSETTILACTLSRAVSVLETLALARDAYLACMKKAGETNNGGPGMDLDEGLLAFAAGAEERIRSSSSLGEVESFDPIPTVYCSYTAWWEGNETFVEGRTLILKPSLGS